MNTNQPDLRKFNAELSGNWRCKQTKTPSAPQTPDSLSNWRQQIIVGEEKGDAGNMRVR